MEPLHAQGRRAAQGARARARPRGGRGRHPAQGRVHAVVRHAHDGPQPVGLRDRQRAREAAVAVCQGRVRGHHPRGRQLLVLRHDVQLAGAQGRGRAEGRGDGGGAAQGVPGRQAAHRHGHLAVPVTGQGVHKRAVAALCAVRARRVHPPLPGGQARVQKGARQRGHPRALLLQEDGHRGVLRQAGGPVRRRGGAVRHPLLRHGGRPRAALPRAHRLLAAAPQPAGQLQGRLLYVAHVRDVAVQPQRHQLQGPGLPH
mmetsp:Transcript_21664/g.55164  ORF Transcript_21664/g.55164 Transcript_21664/m.55164 type:complete len:257 (-) Transcript_21664:679-1449(-)